jgi:hypothetical protein
MTRYHNDLRMVQQRPSENLPLYQTVFPHLEDTFIIIIIIILLFVGNLSNIGIVEYETVIV